MAQIKPFVIYNSKGKKAKYNKVLKSVLKNDVILFGEIHNNPIAHWLEFEIIAEVKKSKPTIIGAEMFETNNQEILNKYLNNEINSTELDSLARLWSNYHSDYAPIVNFAKENNIPFIATNIPRRYAKMVHRKGFGVLDSLPKEEKKWIAPLPIPFDLELKTYKEILSMMGHHGNPKLVMAQAIKDATMAHFISKNLKSDHIFIHLNGAYHSDFYEGILWYLKKENNNLKYLTISTVSQPNINKLSKDNLNRADFVICVDEDMTTTY